jgi:DNA-binding beta-propeller fold protein YncE
MPAPYFQSVSPDGKSAFISDEQNDAITVIDLAMAEKTHYSRDAIVGEIETGRAPITSAFSPDGTKMYVTSEIARENYGFPITCRREGAPPDSKLAFPFGVVLSIDLAKAETNPSTSIVGVTPADCSTVRLSLSPDGRFLWATNRGSNTLTQLDASAIGASNQSAKIASIPVGSNPVPVLATRDGRYVLVGDTNRFGLGGTTDGSISVIDAHDLRIVGTLKAGSFPREFDRGVGTTVFLSNNRSDSIEIFDDRMIRDCVARVGDCSFAPR